MQKLTKQIELDLLCKKLNINVECDMKKCGNLEIACANAINQLLANKPLTGCISIIKLN